MREELGISEYFCME